VLRGAVAFLGLLFAIDVCAQVSGSLTLVSDYRYRGVSLSDEKPAAQASVAYDHSSGWYAGAFGSTVDLAGQSRSELQLLSYAGYAWRVRPGLSWDVGASYYSFTGDGGYNYPEMYFGFASGNLSGRIYYADNYFRQGARALYAELNASRPFIYRLHLLGHVGVLRLDSRSAWSDGSARYRFDVRAGIGVDLDQLSLRLTWLATDAMNAAYPVSENRNRTAFAVSVSRAF
jgi:uncharacterized protein (TIGR02001 family)